MGWGSSQTPQGRSPQALPSFQALAGASSLGLGSSPSPPLCPGQAPAQPLPALSSGGACPCPSSKPLQHWVGWQSPSFQGPQEVPLAPGTVLGGGRGWAGVPGRKLLTRRAKDRVVPYPRSHPCAPPALPSPPPGRPAAFPSPPPLPRPALSCMVPPTPGQPREEHEWRITNQRKKKKKKKTVGPPPPPPLAAHSPASFTQDRPPALSV